MPPRAVIFGCAGTRLTERERSFIRESAPWGFILFARNVNDPSQVRALTDDLRETVGWRAPILIDQEGGRVQRLRPPHWRAAPAQRRFGELAEQDRHAGLRAAWLNARLIAEELADLQIDVDCLPLADQLRPETHEVIGDRAFGSDPKLIGELGRAVADGLLHGGVLPVLKHLPGHGRATVDSHKDLPRTSATYSDLLDIDFKPFQLLSNLQLGMTAHVVYEDIDPAAPATQSQAVIKAIREEICFTGALMTDDLSMEALSGGFATRAERSFAAGCDLVLHCNGEPEEMEEIASVTPELAGESAARCERALSARQTPAPIDAAALTNELSCLLNGG
jgi:beta-N-acetylhexosaminidase